ncbi:MAG: AtpZ/AtpI family protein [bacterium]
MRQKRFSHSRAKIRNKGNENCKVSYFEISPIQNKNDQNLGGAQFLHVGFEFALAIALGAGGGYWLDVQLNTSPLFLVIGLFVGAAAAFLNIYRAVYPTKRNERTNK